MQIELGADYTGVLKDYKGVLKENLFHLGQLSGRLNSAFYRARGVLVRGLPDLDLPLLRYISNRHKKGS